LKDTPHAISCKHVKSTCEFYTEAEKEGEVFFKRGLLKNTPHAIGLSQILLSGCRSFEAAGLLKDTPHAIGLSIKVAGLLKDTLHACRDTLHALDCSFFFFFLTL